MLTRLSIVSESSLCGVVLQDDVSKSYSRVFESVVNSCCPTPASVVRPSAENNSSSVICEKEFERNGILSDAALNRRETG